MSEVNAQQSRQSVQQVLHGRVETAGEVVATDFGNPTELPQLCRQEKTFISKLHAFIEASVQQGTTYEEVMSHTEN